MALALKADHFCKGSKASTTEGPTLCRFLDAGNEVAPHAQLTGVQKAPRHEVAGSLAPAGQRALWGFDAGTDLDGGRDAGGM
jgi:hypothetical protein